MEVVISCQRKTRAVRGVVGNGGAGGVTDTYLFLHLFFGQVDLALFLLLFFERLFFQLIDHVLEVNVVGEEGPFCAEFLRFVSIALLNLVFLFHHVFFFKIRLFWWCWLQRPTLSRVKGRTLKQVPSLRAFLQIEYAALIVLNGSFPWDSRRPARIDPWHDLGFSYEAEELIEFTFISGFLCGGALLFVPRSCHRRAL